MPAIDAIDRLADDFPGQLRKTTAQAAPGARVDIRRFRDAVIGSGGMQFAVLVEHVDRFLHLQPGAAP